MSDQVLTSFVNPSDNISKTIMLKRLRNQRAYHLKSLDDSTLSDSRKNKHQQKLTSIINKIAELTNKPVEEITNQYNKNRKGRPLKK